VGASARIWDRRRGAQPKLDRRRALPAAYRDALIAHFSPHLAALSEESRLRIERNPLRLLDSKDPADVPYVQSAPALESFLCAPCREHFDALKSYLDLPAFRIRSTRASCADSITTEEPFSRSRRASSARKAAFAAAAGTMAWCNRLAARRACGRLCSWHGTLPHDAAGPRLASAKSAARPPSHRVGSASAHDPGTIVAELRRTLEAPTFADYLDRKLLAALKIADRNRARYALILGATSLPRVRRYCGTWSTEAIAECRSIR